MEKIEKIVEEKNEKIHILFVVDHFHPYTGGLQQFVLQLAKRCKSEKVRVSVLTYNYDSKHLSDMETVDGVTIYRLPSTALLGKTYTLPHLFSSKYRHMIHSLETMHVDFVVTNTRFFTSSVVGAHFASRIGAEHIHIEHGNRFVVHSNPIVSFCAWVFDQTFGRWIMSRADHVVAISHIGQTFCKLLGAKHVSIIHNATDTALFKQLDKSEKDAVLKKHSLDGSKTLVLFVGRLIEAKGLQHLFPVMAKLSYPATLVIVGEGPYYDSLAALKKQYAVDVRFLGSLPLADVVSLTLACDICVNPSYSEGIPTNVLEGGAARKAVIATNVGGTKEIIHSSKEGILVSAADEDALLAAFEKFKTQGLRVTCGIHLRRRIEKEFDWSVSAEQFMQVVATLDKRRKSR
ncbi:MAG TPA: glycosyltransferase family 4 protein [Acidobacteriota bacterium]|nr:glycosyltransferase family 4 protein [Acidobacteriota bacterium]